MKQKPFRIAIQPHPAQDLGLTREQVNVARGLGLREVEECPPNDRRVAVVGGGPSLAGNHQSLDGFDEVWAVNGTCAWLKARGIRSKFLSVDPQRELANYVGTADEALLASSTHPDVWPLFARDKIEVFHLYDDDDPKTHKGYIAGSTSSVSYAPRLAAKKGMRSVHFFGCDSSFGAWTHVDRNETFHQDLLYIEAGGTEYLTNIAMMVQAEVLSNLIRELPGYLFNHSGGLLAAMIKHPDTWTVSHLSDYLHDNLKFIEPEKEAA